jgi:polyhydroxybutyrate depolymerase
MCILSILLLLSAMATASVATPAPSQSLADVETTIHVDGFDRTYLIHLPHGTTSTKRLLVVMMLQGHGSSSRSTAHDFGWIEKADIEGFIVVFPQTLPIGPARPAGVSLPRILSAAGTFQQTTPCGGHME